MSGAGIFGSIFFGSVGMAAFVYGRNTSAARPIILGILLMAYPYILPETWEIYAVGTLLTAGLFLFRE